MDDLVAKVAKALQAEANTFGSPVHCYVENEAYDRWAKANPDADLPDFDSAAESWAILARAIIPIVMEDAAAIANEEARWDGTNNCCSATAAGIAQSIRSRAKEVANQ